MAPPIDPLTNIPLHLELFFDDKYLSSGTGFVIVYESKNYLITNWHILSGRDPKTQSPLSDMADIPNKVRVWHHSSKRWGSWVSKDYALEKNGSKTWMERAISGEKVDIAALLIPSSKDITIYPLDLNLSKTDLLITPSEPVSIIGFPYGQYSAGRLPIWKTGFIASEVELPYDGKPIFLIDASTKPGMSGSPVLAKRDGFFRTSSGSKIGGEAAIKFLGVYSGRVSDDELITLSNLGQVWKPQMINLVIKP